jgi:hypothetical protein
VDGREQQRPVWVSLSTIFVRRATGCSHPTGAEDAGGTDPQSESPGLLLH